jgi:hypothetical protein
MGQEGEKSAQAKAATSRLRAQRPSRDEETCEPKSRPHEKPNQAVDKNEGRREEATPVRIEGVEAPASVRVRLACSARSGHCRRSPQVSKQAHPASPATGPSAPASPSCPMRGPAVLRRVHSFANCQRPAEARPADCGDQPGHQRDQTDPSPLDRAPEVVLILEQSCAATGTAVEQP